MSFYTFVVVNPASGDGATGRRWPQIRSALDEVLDRWDNEFTVERGDAERLARQAAGEGYEMIVSVGGDGTMSEVVSGLFRPDGAGGITDELIRKDIVLASVRQGTGGDFARYLGLSGTLPQAVRHLTGPQTRTCDVGLLEYTTPEHAKRTRAFINIASFGLSGVVDDKVNSTTKALGGKTSFLIGLGRALVAYRPRGVRIRVDGEAFYEGKMVTCAVANGQYFGGGMRFAREAEIDDGLFDVVAQLKTGAKEILSIRDLYTGKIADWDTVRYIRGKVVEAEPLSEGDVVLLDVDGEQPGQLPARFRILESAVSLKIP